MNYASTISTASPTATVAAMTTTTTTTSKPDEGSSDGRPSSGPGFVGPISSDSVAANDEDSSAEDDEDLREDTFAAATMPKRRGKEQTVYVIEFETEDSDIGEGHRIRGRKGMTTDGNIYFPILFTAIGRSINPLILRKMFNFQYNFGVIIINKICNREANLSFILKDEKSLAGY